MIVVVEGKHDAARLASVFPNIYVLITNGSAITTEFLQLLVRLQEQHVIVCCLDPDYPGEKIRKAIMQAVPEATHVFAPKREAISRNHKKIGIEHMSTKAILAMFDAIQIPHQTETISMQTMFDLGLCGEATSRSRRASLGEGLKIGYANAKTMHQRLNLFGFTEQDVKEFL